ncbi:LysR family transcriptional regulator [Hydrogenophaga sp.]|uniref:LysR family transcriptional regulator n=1 Tax=Hydrogenophaga sp. TaxID=1904254 RepID=UPI0027201670|nr:LysR family transcriptional regulator [Hydrogenophaga sp.]MDO9437060.1 LysR family transcriptional regulator [Hydrogenophaga sp.]
MQLRFMKYFSVLCEELHFGRAASRLAITQSPLSAAIKSLETELGVQLLIRNSKLVRLTPAGETFLVEANQMLDRMSDVKRLVASVDHGLRGRLNIGVAVSTLYREVPLVLSRFRREMPGVEVVLHETASKHHLQALLSGDVHAAFIAGGPTVPTLKGMALKTDTFCVCLPQHHALATRRSVNLRELADERFVTFARSATPVGHDNILAILVNAGIHPSIEHRARTWLSIVAMVAQDGGVAVVPRSLSRAGLAGVCFVPLGGRAPLAPASLVWNPKKPTPELKRFIEVAAATIQPAKATAGKATAGRQHQNS